MGRRDFEVVRYAIDHPEKIPPEVWKELLEDPAFFIWLAFDEWLWSKQREIALALLKYKRVAVYSCHSSGKSHLASRLALYIAQTRPQSITVITAPKYEQAKDVIWRGVMEAYIKSRIKLLGEPDSTKWNIQPGKWYAKVSSTKRVDAFQGIHAPYLFFVFDEATGIPDEIWEATEANLASGEGYWLVLGNPLRPEGRFYQTQFDPTFYKVKISAFDTPLFTGEIDRIPEKYAKILRKLLITPKFVEEAKLKYGEDSPYYRVKVLAEFPVETASSLFKLSDIDYAFRNKKVEAVGDVIITCDPARYGEDYTVITVWKGLKMLELIPIRKSSTAYITQLLKNLAIQYKAVAINIDEVGLGIGIVDTLRNDGELIRTTNINGVHPQREAFNDRLYADTRTEMFFNLKQVLEKREVYLIPSKELKNELLAMEYTFDNEGRFKLVSKDIIKKKLGRSPDFADAVALRFASLQPRVGIY